MSSMSQRDERSPDVRLQLRVGGGRELEQALGIGSPGGLDVRRISEPAGQEEQAHAAEQRRADEQAQAPPHPARQGTLADERAVEQTGVESRLGAGVGKLAGRGFLVASGCVA